MYKERRVVTVMIAVLSALDLRVISWTAAALSFTNKGFTIASFGVDLLDGRLNLKHRLFRS